MEEFLSMDEDFSGIEELLIKGSVLCLLFPAEQVVLWSLPFGSMKKKKKKSLID